MSAADGFTVRVRWRLSEDRRLEVETEHGDFPSPETAALFANGIGEQALFGLRMSRTGLSLELVNGRTAAFKVVGSWQLSESAEQLGEVVRDEDFISVSLRDLVALGAPSARGEESQFRPLRYCVFGPSGPVDVKVALDEEGNVEVTVFEEPETEEEIGFVLLSA